MIYKNGQTSIITRVSLRDSGTGLPKTGLLFSSSGLSISTIADNEATATTYTNAASKTETITTLGTFAAPTATKCRFKEVDATNHPGIYEIQIADARWAVSNAKSVIVTVQCTNVLTIDKEVQLASVDPYDTVRMGMTALPNTAVTTNASLLTSGTGTDQLSVSSGQVLVQSGTGTGQLAVTSGVVNSNVTQLAGDSTAATNLSTSSKTMEPGTAVTGTLTSTSFTTDLSSSTDDAYVGRIVIFTSGALIRQVGVITDYVGSSKTITVSSAFTTAPSNSDGIIVV